MSKKFQNNWIYLQIQQWKITFMVIYTRLLFWMDWRPLVNGRIANFGIFLDVFEFSPFGWFFSVFQMNRVLGNSWSTLLWYRCYYPNWSQDALSPVCGIFSNKRRRQGEFGIFRHFWIKGLYRQGTLETNQKKSLFLLNQIS